MEKVKKQNHSEHMDSLVDQYRIASETNDREAYNDLCVRLLDALQTVVASVNAKWRNLGTFVEETANEKLYQCLNVFIKDRQKTGFKYYFRRSLCNAAVDEYRRSKLYPFHDDTMIDEIADPNFEYESGHDLAHESFKLYASRKRAIINDIKLSTPSQISNLLLDQRQRRAACNASIWNIYTAKQPSSIVEELEEWNASDCQRKLNTDHNATIADVWEHFADRFDKDHACSAQIDLIEAANRSGSPMKHAAWRKKVSRYMNELRELLSENEWLLFDCQPTRTN
jgi:DNA-directed RNA polymerase specialized sigma24 family protein